MEISSIHDKSMDATVVSITLNNKKQYNFLLPRYNNPYTKITEYTHDFSLTVIRDLHKMLDDYLNETIDIKTS